MSDTTSVPSIVFGPNGAVAPAESAIVTGLDADWNAAFGGDLNTDPPTPAGQIIASNAAMLGDNNDQWLFIFNNVDPAYASGRMQDAIARIYFLYRNPAQSTVLQIAVTGLSGVVIPVNALIADPSGEIYFATAQVTIPPSGTTVVPFASQTAGPVPVPATVAIYQSVPGWNTVAVASGVVGNLVESTSAFEARRAASVAANGAGFLPAIRGAVAAVSGVLDYYVTENYTGSPVTVGGVTLAANSLYVCVAGGAQADVAYAIWTKKNPGCGYTGNTTVTVYDTNSGYSPPYPSYSVTYETPSAEAICMIVSIQNSAAVPSNALTLIQNAIIAAFYGIDGGARARIGSTIFASRFYAGVAMLGAWAQIVSILIGTNAAPTVTFTGTISGASLTVSGVTGTLAVGQFLYGASVAHGTYIVSGSGTSWIVAGNQTVGPEAMTSVAAVNNDATMNINQLPTLFGGDIGVVLV